MYSTWCSYRFSTALETDLPHDSLCANIYHLGRSNTPEVSICSLGEEETRTLLCFGGLWCLTSVTLGVPQWGSASTDCAGESQQLLRTLPLDGLGGTISVLLVSYVVHLGGRMPDHIAQVEWFTIAQNFGRHFGHCIIPGSPQLEEANSDFTDL